jgi:hypothetical protein
VPELLLLSAWQPIRTAWGQWRTAPALRRLATRNRGRRRAVCAQACAEALAPIALRNTLQYHIARSAVAAWGPRAYVTFYEGQPWEVPAWLGARSVDGVLTIGYQHTIMMPYSFSLLSPNVGGWERATPDLVSPSPRQR